MACNTSTYNLGVRNIILGADRVQKFCVFTKADVASSMQNTFFVVHEPVTQAKHYFWFNVGAAGADPAIPNATAHVVALVANDSAISVATKLNTVIDALSWAESTTMQNEVEVEMVAPGYAYFPRNALDVTASPKFNIKVVQFGSVEKDLGATDGDTTFTIEEQTLEITSPQTGDYVLGEIRRGAKISSAFSLKDTSTEAVRKAINFYGSSAVTDDAASAVISGYGTSNLFQSKDDVADKLVFRPTALAADSDPSQDFTIHKAALKLGELTFTSDSEFLLPVEVSAYLDPSKASFANMFSYGDASKLPSA